MTLEPGTRLGRYEVRSLLGVGGMGEVYLAWDPDLDREVAIKVIRDGAQESDRVRRFVQEAKAASGLHHPNVAHVYEIGSQDNLRFIAMERVEGETLRERISRGPMPMDQVLELGTQIASALGAAHKAGIIHRDIKPENVIVTPDGYAKVLDFGLAKLKMITASGAESSGDAPTILKTRTGIAMGTLGYMAPEQFLGDEVTPAIDVYSLGVVLHEMVEGKRPVEGKPGHSRAHVPPKLEAVIARSLARDPDDRYPDSGEVFASLREISREMTIGGREPSRRFPVGVAIALVVLILVVAASWALMRSKRQRDALGQVERAESLLKERRLAEAFEASMAVLPILPNDDRLRDVISRTSGKLTVESEPTGATVYVQRFRGPAARTRIGVTPLTISRFPHGDYLLTLEKTGYAGATRPFSTMPVDIRGTTISEPLTLTMKLAEASKVPAGMVLVEGGSYRLSGFYRPSERVIELDDFFIDRLEVSNQDFAEFIRDGGYRRRELWKHGFIDAGRPLSFEQALERFRDTTGQPGPRGWSGGAPPAGRESHPVTDVTWYEAAAYAEWKGKKLPTVHQWEKAARHPGHRAFGTSFPWGFVWEGTDVTERANFLAKGTMPVDTMPFGASPSGARHMAGNVAEWCRNALPPGFAARGGAWNDAIYAFGRTAGYPAFYTAPTLGFRCVSGGSGDEGDFALSPHGFVPVYKPVDDATFEEIRRRYDYEPAPLQAKVVERIETPDWTREKIHYVVAGKTVPAYLYLPKRFPRPLQVIQYAPAGDVTGGWRTLPESIEGMLAPLIRGGRAVFSVELEGFLGRPRPRDWVAPNTTEIEYVDFNVGRVTEMRRGLDYLETRSDIDKSRIALMGISAGGGTGVFATALESRYRSVFFAGTGINRREEPYAMAANRIHFVPRIRAPKMMLQGRYDEDTSLKIEAEPMFRLLSEPKKLQVYEGGHAPPAEVYLPAVKTWLDETMGPV